MAGPYARLSWVVALACTSALTACDGDSRVTKPPHSLASPTASAPPSSAAPSTAPPADKDPAGEHLVLRWRETGGFVGKGGPGSLPDFSLYSTGRAVVASGGDPVEYRLKPAALRRLLDEARAAGLGRSHTTGSGQVADAITLEFTFGDATTKIIQPESQSDPAVRFRERLDPRGWPAADLAAPRRSYSPARVAILAGEGADGTVKSWPLSPLGKGEQSAGGICTLAPAAKVPDTRPGIAWRSQGKTYSVRLRPLLPGESTCRDIA
ncbi:hypothetical protein AGRA3207_006019 [Actinomadura graeca]|uniref:Lipoprotein n=1 Tax=Actinomadura graeca TaxID=2750812 RepID=A0ABX8R2J0_9ACTN|nr:hypothetical protein [Actinomadura graeca]QXJ24649.1 hypothetical protein AGRA3207_006019 [Actinomadura graeca]